MPEYVKLLDSDGDEFQAARRGTGCPRKLVLSACAFIRVAPQARRIDDCRPATTVPRFELSLRRGRRALFDRYVTARRRARLSSISGRCRGHQRNGSPKGPWRQLRVASVRVVAPDIQGRYFRIADQSVEVLPEIRNAVRFIRANIIDVQFAFQGEKFDAVFCRNLLIYLTPAARRGAASGRWLALPQRLVFRRTRRSAPRDWRTFRAGSGTWCVRVLSIDWGAGRTICAAAGDAGTLPLR